MVSLGEGVLFRRGIVFQSLYHAAYHLTVLGECPAPARRASMLEVLAHMEDRAPQTLFKMLRYPSQMGRPQRYGA